MQMQWGVPAVQRWLAQFVQCTVHCMGGWLAGCRESGFGDPYSLPPAAIYTQLGLREDLGIP